MIGTIPALSPYRCLQIFRENAGLIGYSRLLRRAGGSTSRHDAVPWMDCTREGKGRPTGRAHYAIARVEKERRGQSVSGNGRLVNTSLYSFVPTPWEFLVLLCARLFMGILSVSSKCSWTSHLSTAFFSSLSILRAKRCIALSIHWNPVYGVCA
jgi:hypothetical protein